MALPTMCFAGGEATDAKPYHSPYSVQFSFPVKELLGDILTGEKGKPENQSAVAFDQWYSDKTRLKWGAWGPPAKAFDLPGELKDKPSAWQRQRLIAVALRYEGYSYQHHHLPDWDPPADWPWKEVGRGHNAKGVDCSNFTGFVYNLALGIKLSGDINEQTEQLELNPTGQHVVIQKIDKPATWAECPAKLRTGDLLYIHDKSGKVSHVILWVGNIGRSKGDVPLVIDSTGTGHIDSDGQPIPDGVHLRPFNEKGWYWQSLSEVHRIVMDAPD